MLGTKSGNLKTSVRYEQRGRQVSDSRDSVSVFRCVRGVDTRGQQSVDLTTREKDVLHRVSMSQQ